MIAEVNRYLRGWHWYFKEVWSPWPEEAFARFDRYVRVRLRLALCGRVGMGWWNVVLKNRVLYELGLVRLDELQADWTRGALRAPVRKHRPGGEPDAGKPHVRFGEAGWGPAPP